MTRIESLREQANHARRALERELDRGLREARERFSYQIEKGRVIFDHAARGELLEKRIKNWAYISRTPIAFLLTAPVIYGVFIPIACLDLAVSVYQQICFRVYGIALVRRKDYVKIDRHRLPYLNGVQKLNCVYCGYGNGVIAYAREIAARTEQFWCPIKHAMRAKGQHSRTSRFVDYGDAESWQHQLKDIRIQLKQED